MKFLELEPGITTNNNKIPLFRTTNDGKKYLYLMAGTHGDEIEGIHLLKKLFQWLQSDEIQANIPMIVIPIQNIDGHQAVTRQNANGVDLNRNFPTDDWKKFTKDSKYNPGTHPLSEVENSFLVKLFEQYPPSLIISFHSWDPMINYNGDSKEIADFLNRHNNYVVKADIEGHITPGSLGTYGPTKHNCGVITFECPELTPERIKERGDLTLDDIWKENEMAFKKLFKSDLLNTKY